MTSSHAQFSSFFSLVSFAPTCTNERASRGKKKAKTNRESSFEVVREKVQQAIKMLKWKRVKKELGKLKKKKRVPVKKGKKRT